MTDDGYLSLNVRDLLCFVCQDRASGNHYGVPTCDGCRGFFKRSVRKKAAYVCKNEKKCKVDALRRNQCQACRFKKCLEVKMNPDAVQLQRESRTSKRKVEDSNDENIPTIKRFQNPISSPGIDSSMNSTENSDSENDRSTKSKKQEDVRPTFPDLEKTPVNSFNGISHLAFPCHPLFRPDLPYAMMRPGFTPHPFLTPSYLRPDLPSTLNHCLSPRSGVPCMYFTCPLCFDWIFRAGSQRLHKYGPHLDNVSSRKAGML